ncbi:MAG: phosphoribosyltransferase [Micrococcales bacterium 73-13]|nr:MAG: phosphoribosyltransferase [Micrococcales bacterium 73-13]
MTDAEREILTWPRFGESIRDLALVVHGSGYRPDLVVAIARGGMLLAGGLAYALGVKACDALNIEFYTGVGQTLPRPEVLQPLLDPEALAGARVLLVDDVADSGRTLRLAVDLLSERAAQVRSAVLYTKPTTIIQPDYSWAATERWITFPWSAEPLVGGGTGE